MAKCDLSIELDDPQKIYFGGDTISGVVRVRADADVKCNGLEVSSGWKTHGRGNVASGTESSVVVFAGEWTAGEQNEYRFELPVANWPPSYHGHYLNVDHYIDARAKIPWAFDPKASVPFLMRPTGTPDVVSRKSKATEISGVLGCVILGIFVSVFLGVGGMIAAATFPIGLFVFIGVGLLGLGFWIFKVFLPKYLLGEVQYFLTEETVSPGAAVSGELLVQPRRNVSLNGITLTCQAREQCVSGSGSNRTTHKNVFFEKVDTLQEATTLAAGQQQRFPFSITLPDDAPYSIDLDDNDLIWSTTLRIDIPRWPDWKKELTLTVVPSGEPVPTASGAAAGSSSSRAAVGSAVSPPRESGEITFGETVQHIWTVREDREQVELLVEAVTGLNFTMEAVVERRLLYGGDEDPHVYQDGYVVWAHYPDPPLPMVLYVPHELADEFENIGRDQWQGRGMIVGWEARHGRLQVKIEPPA